MMEKNFFSVKIQKYFKNLIILALNKNWLQKISREHQWNGEWKKRLQLCWKKNHIFPYITPIHRHESISLFFSFHFIFSPFPQHNNFISINCKYINPKALKMIFVYTFKKYIEYGCFMKKIKLHFTFDQIFFKFISHSCYIRSKWILFLLLVSKQCCVSFVFVFFWG